MPNIPAMPTPEGLSGQPVPPGWSADMWRVVAALRRAEERRALDTGDGRGRRERTAALVKMTSATVGDVYLTSSSARETGATIKALDGVTLVNGAWYLALWMDIDGGSYWTVLSAESTDRYVAVNASDAPDYLEDQFSTAGNVTTTTVDESGDKLIRLDADEDMWGDLTSTPVKILAKDASGNVGWIPIEDVCGYCEDEWCPDLADEYTLTYTNEVWIIDDGLKYFDGNPPPTPTFTRVGNSCEWTLVDSRTRSFDKLHFDRSACLTASDSGTTYTLKRDAGKTRWEVWEGSVLLGWNNDASAPDAGVWTANTAEAGGYAGTYEEGGAVANCGYTDETAGIKVLTIGVS
jgi:hypothetical protein